MLRSLAWHFYIKLMPFRINARKLGHEKIRKVVRRSNDNYYETQSYVSEKKTSYNNRRNRANLTRYDGACKMHIQ